METEETYQERYTRAKARVEEIRDFYSHLLIYIFVNIGIASLTYYQNEWETAWLLFTLGGWDVSYTYLTLTTIYTCELSVVLVLLDTT